mmetsp:Transcript_19870/g.45111  ORF Transcript_19870/g.45111 Transcript_19870/m.45111 type:complete len:261 (-) Transcript_19870:913-1695(-)
MSCPTIPACQRTGQLCTTLCKRLHGLSATGSSIRSAAAHSRAVWLTVCAAVPLTWAVLAQHPHSVVRTGGSSSLHWRSGGHPREGCGAYFSCHCPCGGPAGGRPCPTDSRVGLPRSGLLRGVQCYESGGGQGLPPGVGAPAPPQLRPVLPWRGVKDAGPGSCLPCGQGGCPSFHGAVSLNPSHPESGGTHASPVDAAWRGATPGLERGGCHLTSSVVCRVTLPPHLSCNRIPPPPLPGWRMWGRILSLCRRQRRRKSWWR